MCWVCGVEDADVWVGRQFCLCVCESRQYMDVSLQLWIDLVIELKMQL